MKNKKGSTILKILVIIAIAAICTFGFFIYSNETKDGQNQSDKIEKEIDYLDTKLTGIINQLNGIELENYKLTITKIEEEENKNSSGSSNNESQKQSKEEGQEEENSQQETKISKMEQEVIKTEGETNWEWIQGETEVLYSVWPTIVLDMYDIDVESSKILEFSNTLDQTLINIKEKNKEKTAENFAKLYSLLPELAKKSEIQVLKIDIIEVKSNIINAYASIESKSWEKAESEVSKAEKSMEIVMSDISKKEDQRKYNINKIYIQIEEIKNSLSTKDMEIFYIKYKNLIQELNTVL